MTKLTAKGAATRQRIIEGAARVIREVGLGETTLDDIRMRTATSKSQLFHYFPSGRDELLLAVAGVDVDAPLLPLLERDALSPLLCLRPHPRRAGTGKQHIVPQRAGDQLGIQKDHAPGLRRVLMSDR